MINCKGMQHTLVEVSCGSTCQFDPLTSSNVLLPALLLLINVAALLLRPELSLPCIAAAVGADVVSWGNGQREVSAAVF